MRRCTKIDKYEVWEDPVMIVSECSMGLTDCVRLFCGSVLPRLSRGTKGQVCLRCLPKIGNKITSDVHALLEKEMSFLQEISPFEILRILKFS